MDFVVRNHGSIITLSPLTEAAKDWVQDHLYQAEWFGLSVVIEPRYIEPILQGIRDDGLTIGD